MPNGRRRPLLIASSAAFAVLIVAHVGTAYSAGEGGAPAARGGVSALGRIEPEHGLIRVGSSSTPTAVSGAVVRELLVEAGADVRRGQVIAVMDNAHELESSIAVASAQLTAAERQAEAASSRVDEACALSDVAGRTSVRRTDLMRKGLASKEEADQAAGDAKARNASCAAARTAAVAAKSEIAVAKAELARRESDLDRTRIRAPMDGRVIEVMARPGELVTTQGVVEMANVAKMYAIAEVYETDVRRVRVGQKATVTSRALEAPLSGTVERIRQKVQKQDEEGTDPAASKDARIVEVEVLLDNPAAVAALSNLQVEVVIRP